jgi:putative Ca2+/H+ antiporter (TMEM165/GDT1 family)
MDWKLMATSFTVVFLAELGDKTQLAALSLSGESRRPLEVFIGASVALVLVTLIGVVAGSWLGRRLPERVVSIASALLFIGIGVWLLARAWGSPSG